MHAHGMLRDCSLNDALCADWILGTRMRCVRCLLANGPCAPTHLRASHDACLLACLPACLQGRMKFLRPLYRALFRSKAGKQAALDTFAACRATYHPIAQKMVAADLGV